MGEKSSELGGQRVERGVVRHGFEGGAVTALSALVVAKWGAIFGISDPWQQAAALSVLVGLLGAVAKFWHENRITARLLGFLPPAPPAAGAILAACLLSGCAIQLGTADPKEFHGAFGETIVACEIKGISIAVGDADICRNVEGGKVSQTFADMTLGVIRVVGSAVAGFFSGLGGAGQGMQQALAPTPAAPAAPDQPVIFKDEASTEVGSEGAPARAPFQ